ncbi:terminase family protein [Mesorhizobium sp. B1-1-9]|uniref:phage terminase large subunit family protein n=1 Tax=Mesorhizobium sp. B1-1-9 TaxID=2589975 RepID=UPI001FEDB68B|nr:terminase family protein [Mesorhizobium sp. B1-1-9]
MSRHVTFMTIDDAAHYSPDERAAIVAAYPAHEREARARGIPVLGSGRIFPVAEALIACEPFRLPRYWPRLGALDFGWDHPSAAVELAWDTEADVVYVTKAVRASQQTPAMQTLTLKPWGEWLPFAWPRDGRRETLEGAGVALAKQYAAHGLNMLTRHAQFPDGSVSVEAGLMEMLDRMQSGRFKVFSTLVEWWEEFRLFHRKDGQVVKLRDDLMAATRYRKLTLAYVSGSGALPTTAGGIWLMFDRTGDKGADGLGAGDFTGPASSVSDNIVTFNGTSGKAGKDSGIKASDLIAGPASAVADNIATFNGTTGKIAKDSGVAVSSLAPKASPTFTGVPAAPTAAPGTNTTQLATTGFVKAAIDVVLGGVSTTFDTLAEIAAGMLQKAADNLGLAAGFTSVVVDDGTKSSGTYTPAPTGGNYRKITANGAFTFAAPSTANCYNMTIDIANGASAGAITFSGFVAGHPKGDAYATTNAAKFKLHISKTDTGITAVLEAL